MYKEDVGRVVKGRVRKSTRLNSTLEGAKQQSTLRIKVISIYKQVDTNWRQHVYSYSYLKIMSNLVGGTKCSEEEPRSHRFGKLIFLKKSFSL